MLWLSVKLVISSDEIDQIDHPSGGFVVCVVSQCHMNLVNLKTIHNGGWVLQDSMDVALLLWVAAVYQYGGATSVLQELSWTAQSSRTDHRGYMNYTGGGIWVAEMGSEPQDESLMLLKYLTSNDFGLFLQGALLALF